MDCVDKYVVYFHRNPVSSAVFYVGMGFKKRAFDIYNRNRFWHSYVKKHGLPIIDVIESDLTKERAHEIEVFWISKFGKRIDDEGGILVNLTSGGDGWVGMKHSPETIKKLSELKSGPNNHFFGKHLTEEHKEKLRNSFPPGLHPNKNKKRPCITGDKNPKSRTVINKDTGEVFATITLAAKSLGIRRWSLSRKLNGERRNNTNLTYGI